jgi:uncharacterized protein
VPQDFHPLSDGELSELGAVLARVQGGQIGNIEALDGFCAALACCPDLVMPSEFLPVVQAGATEAGDLVFDTMSEARRFTDLIMRHWNDVNQRLENDEAFLPLLLEDADGVAPGNDWANGFLAGTQLRRDIWGRLIADDERAGPIVPILILAHEHHPDPGMRPYSDPIDREQRDELIVSMAAGVMRMHQDFKNERLRYRPQADMPLRRGPKVGRNDPCPCGSGRKYKRCCGDNVTIH